MPKVNKHQDTHPIFTNGHRAQKLSVLRQAQLDEAQKTREKWIDRRNQILAVGSGLALGEGASVYFSKKEFKQRPIGVMAKMAGVLHRYGIIQASYSVRQCTNASMRVYGAVKHMTNKKIRLAPELAGANGVLLSLSGTYAVVAGVSTIKAAYNLGYNVRADIKVHHDRLRYADLIRNYDPVSGKFRTPHGLRSRPEQIAQIQTLLAKKYAFRATDAGDVSRSRLQAFGDRASNIYEMTQRGLLSTVFSMTLLKPGVIVSSATPAVSTVIQGMQCVYNAYRVGMHTVACNNTFNAMKNSRHNLLQAMGRHAVNQRFDQIRIRALHGLGSGANALNTLIAFGALASPVSPLGAGLLVAGATLQTASHLIGGLYELKHARTIEKYRVMSEANCRDLWEKAPKEGVSQQWIIEKRDAYFTELAKDPKNIGYAEYFTLRMLRGSIKEEREKAVNFLQDMGFSFPTIVKIQQTPQEKEALNVLRLNLYNNKLTYKPKNTKHIFTTAANVVGIASAYRAVKRYREHKAHQQTTSIVK